MFACLQNIAKCFYLNHLRRNTRNSVRSNKYIYDSFQIERNVITVTVFRTSLITQWNLLNWVHNQKRKTVTTIILLSNWKESEIDFSECSKSKHGTEWISVSIESQETLIGAHSNSAFRLVVRCSFVFVNNNCCLLK